MATSSSGGRSTTVVRPAPSARWSDTRTGLPDDDLGNVVHAIVEPEDDDLDIPELLTFLGERLVRYEVPRTVELVHEPLRNDAGKVRRTALRAERLHPA